MRNELSRSRFISLTALNAALYAAFSLATAYIPTPFIIQFRPAVVIPAIFAALFGPLVGGLGAAIGTFTASILRYGTPLLTIFSGTPANFVGFYILGYLTEKYDQRGSWFKGFIIGGILGLLAGFTIIAIGLYFLATVVGLQSLVNWTNPGFIATALVFGIASELPFVLFLGPPVIKLVKSSRLA